MGTRKVIAEHSTIGLVVTTDGSITDLPRAEYAECEERVITELQELGKPLPSCSTVWIRTPQSKGNGKTAVGKVQRPGAAGQLP